jgi:uncharacterized membrane protein YeaQ/YmgE (transglycosylase-associated protein family)
MGKTERHVYGLLLVVGVIALACGLLGDAHNWWGNHGYLGNIVAGITGAGFGVPVLGTLVRRASEEGQRRASRVVALRRAATATIRICGYIDDGMDRSSPMTVSVLLAALTNASNRLLGEDVDAANPYQDRQHFDTRNKIFTRAFQVWVETDLAIAETFPEFAETTAETRVRIDVIFGQEVAKPLEAVQAMAELWMDVLSTLGLFDFHQALSVQ